MAGRFSSMAAMVQAKVITKLISKKSSKGEGTPFSILDETGNDMLEKMHSFITAQADTARADEVMKDLIKIFTKISVLYWNGMLTDLEEQKIGVLVQDVHKVVQSFLAAVNPAHNISPLLERLSIAEGTIISIIKPYYSEKSIARTRNFVGYFKDSSVYEYLWQEVNQEYLQSLVHHFELSIPKLEATFTFLDSKTEAER